MATVKISALPAKGSVVGTDIVPIVDEEAMPIETKSITWADALAYVVSSIFGATTGILTADGSGNVAAATPDVDYATPTLVQIQANTLLATVNVDFTSPAQTTLYTVPGGKSLIIDKVVIIPASDTNNAIVNVGQFGALTDFVGPTTLQPCSPNDAFYLEPIPSVTPSIQKLYPTGTVIQMDVTFNAGGATNAVQLYGILI